MSERTCVTCAHWYWHGGDQGYSECTPGTEFSTECRKNHWEMPDYPTQNEFRLTVLKAELCPDYSEMT